MTVVPTPSKNAQRSTSPKPEKACRKEPPFQNTTTTRRTDRTAARAVMAIAISSTDPVRLLKKETIPWEPPDPDWLSKFCAKNTTAAREKLMTVFLSSGSDFYV